MGGQVTCVRYSDKTGDRTSHHHHPPRPELSTQSTLDFRARLVEALAAKAQSNDIQPERTVHAVITNGNRKKGKQTERIRVSVDTGLTPEREQHHGDNVERSSAAPVRVNDVVQRVMTQLNGRRRATKWRHLASSGTTSLVSANNSSGHAAVQVKQDGKTMIHSSLVDEDSDVTRAGKHRSTEPDTDVTNEEQTLASNNTHGVERYRKVKVEKVLSSGDRGGSGGGTRSVQEADASVREMTRPDGAVRRVAIAHSKQPVLKTGASPTGVLSAEAELPGGLAVEAPGVSSRTGIKRRRRRASANERRLQPTSSAATVNSDSATRGSHNTSITSPSLHSKLTITMVTVVLVAAVSLIIIVRIVQNKDTSTPIQQ